MTQDPVAELLAEALRDLCSYVDRREESFTEDDDVRALESVASVLSQVPPGDLARLRSLLGPEVAFALGLSES
jgi:hypothetical protein